MLTNFEQYGAIVWTCPIRLPTVEINNAEIQTFKETEIGKIHVSPPLQRAVGYRKSCVSVCGIQTVDVFANRLL